MSGQKGEQLPGSFNAEFSYKDQNGTARNNEIFSCTRGSTGAVSATINAADRWYFGPVVISAKASQAIVIKTVAGTFTGCTYDLLSYIVEKSN